jgi:hypothetical protein
MTTASYRDWPPRSHGNQMALIATIGAQLNTGDFHIRSHVACISVAIAPPAGNNGFPDDAS